MPKIKLVKLTGYYDNSDDFREVIQSYSDWQEVSEEDLSFLKSREGSTFLYNQCAHHNYCNESIVILEDVPKETTSKYIGSIREVIQKEKDRIELEKKTKAEKQAIYKQKQKAKEIEIAKKLLQEEGLL